MKTNLQKSTLKCFRTFILLLLTTPGLQWPTYGQTGVYTLDGATASLVGITNSTSTADQSGISVYSSGNLAVAAVNGFTNVVDLAVPCIFYRVQLP